MNGRGARAEVGLLVAATLLGALPAWAIDHEVQRFDLDPGTKIVLVEDHRVPLVYASFEFPVGSWSPWVAEHHAEEAFLIQLHDPAGSLRSRADRLAADLSVRVRARHSIVSVSCLRDDLDAALALVRDLLENREFDRHELKRWKRNDKLGWASSQKEPGFKLRQAAARLLFARDDPRRRAYEKPLPKVTNLRRLIEARDTVVRLPGRVIAFAGDLTGAEARHLASGLLPDVLDRPPDGLEPVLGAMTPVERLPAEHTVTMPRIAQTFFGYGRHSLTYDDARYPAFMVADHVLGGHFFSRLYRALRHEGGETYGARTTGRGGVHRGGYALTTFTRGDNAAVAEEKIREVLRELHAGGITEDERRAAVGYLVGRRPFSRQSPAQVLERFLGERRHDLPEGFHDDLVDRAARVSLDEINAFVREFYDPSRFRMVKVQPK